MTKPSRDYSSPSKLVHYATYGRPPAEDLEARLAEIPEDTRDLTGRMFGDPLPGRSALAQRSA